ncbi:hypothetical protein AB0D27_18115 [Streptomyces sp. NPDC048415]|uniref:hypothetical protein n=1 Tax=Streptomyces sp. NPDC048415 TaxID=3154822 RepID=UPI003436BC6E
MHPLRTLKSPVRTVSALLAVLGALTVMGCAATGPEATSTTAGRGALVLPTTERGMDDLIDTAQRVLVERCLARRGLTVRRAPDQPPPSPEEDRRLQVALFGRGRRELSVTLATGYTVTAHTDGCLAAAQDELYGDQRLWFRTRVVVNNLRAEAQQRMSRDPDYRAARARWTRCVAPAHGPRRERPDPARSARCSHRSGLAGLRARLEPALLERVRADRRDQLTTYRQLRTRALRRAAALYAERAAPVTPEKGSTSS